MRHDSHNSTDDRLDAFESALRCENELIHPSDDLAARIELRLDEKARPTDRYRLVIASFPFHRQARRLFLPIAALIAIGITISLFILPRTAPPATPSVAIGDSSAVKDDQAVATRPPHRASVAITGNTPTILHELPTERDDVTIVWLYDAPKSAPPAEPRIEPVGVVPTTEIHATGTHS